MPVKACLTPLFTHNPVETILYAPGQGNNMPGIIYVAPLESRLHKVLCKIMERIKVKILGVDH